MDEPTEEISPFDVGHAAGLFDGSETLGYLKLQSSMQASPVVVLHLDRKDAIKMPGAEDQQPVQTLCAKHLYPSLGEGVRVRRPDRRAGHPDPFRYEDIIEGAGELSVSVAKVSGISSRLLFVCAGNTCRSPMAAALAGSVLPQAVVESAGRLPGYAVAENALSVVSEMTGADIFGHRPRDIAEVHLAEFDLIVVLDHDVAEELEPVMPSGVARVPELEPGSEEDRRRTDLVLRRSVGQRRHHEPGRDGLKQVTQYPLPSSDIVCVESPVWSPYLGKYLLFGAYEASGVYGIYRTGSGGTSTPVRTMGRRVGTRLAAGSSRVVHWLGRVTRLNGRRTARGPAVPGLTARAGRKLAHVGRS